MNGIADEYTELLGAYALDAVDDVERKRIEQHLAGCDVCAAEVRQLREAATELSTLAGDRERLPDRFTERLMELLEEVHPQRRPRAVRLAVTVGALAAVIVAIAGAFFLSTLPSRDVNDLVASGHPVALHAAGSFEGRGTVYVGRGRAAVVLSALPAPGRARTYQLWLIRGGVPASLGVLGGHDDLRTVVKTNGRGTFAVTNEPAGGSRSPTSAPVLTSS